MLSTIADIYKNHPSDIQQQNIHLRNVLTEEANVSSHASLSAVPLKSVIPFLEKIFDAENGGFGSAPKFPHPPIIEFLLQHKSPMAYFSLLKMAQGGIYDQLEGGFFRYSVDKKWEIPHFEKMLYDNAQLMFLYALASHIFEEPDFNGTAEREA